MATDILSALADMIFIGNVSSTIPEEGKAVVTRLDREGVVTAPLSVINRGAAHDKDYWMPAIDDQVLCFSSADPTPDGADNGKRVLTVPGDMTLNIGGTLLINSSGGDVVVNGISLVHHVHGGVESGGSTTSGPE